MDVLNTTAPLRIMPRSGAESWRGTVHATEETTNLSMRPIGGFFESGSARSDGMSRVPLKQLSRHYTDGCQNPNRGSGLSTIDTKTPQDLVRQDAGEEFSHTLVPGSSSARARTSNPFATSLERLGPLQIQRGGATCRVGGSWERSRKLYVIVRTPLPPQCTHR